MSVILRDGQIIIVKNHLNFEDKINNFKAFLWNPDRREFLGRTKESWGKICCFYFCFYTILGGVFVGSIASYLALSDYRYPTYQNQHNVMSRQRIDDKIIGTNPGMGFRPLVDEQTSLIRVRSSAKNLEHPYNYVQYVKNLNDYLAYYFGEEVWWFGPNTPCTPQRNYEFDRARPCILVKLNRIYDWVPVAYEPTDPLPIELKPYEKLVREKPLNIFVLCEGENQVDKDLIGHIRYFSKTPDGPGEGPLGFLPFDSYPWIKQDDYYTPLVFAYFTNITTNVLVNVMCKAFAKNIYINALYRVGSVHFELFIE